MLNPKLYSGAKWKWTESISGYPATDYNLKVVLKYQTNDAITINASASGEDFSIDYTAAADLPNGDYAYQVKLTEKAVADNIILYEAGAVHIYPNLETVSDAREYWMQQVEYLKAAYQKLAQRETKEIIVNGKRVLYEDRNQLLKEIHNAEIKAGLKKVNTTYYGRFKSV